MKTTIHKAMSSLMAKFAALLLLALGCAGSAWGATVAKIGSTGYATLVDAFAAANASSAESVEITLLSDLDFSQDPYSDYKWNNFLKITRSNVTLDLNGKTISNMGNCALCFGNILARDGRISNCCIKNGTLNAGTTDGVRNSYVLGVAGVDGMTITGLTCLGGINVFTQSADVEIVDCNFTGTKYYTVCAQTGSEVTIKGTTSAYTKNTDSTVATKAMFWVQGAGTDDDCKTDANPTGAFGASSVVIESGTFTVDTANGGTFMLNSGVAPVVKGGTFNIDPTPYCAADYAPRAEGGMYTVEPKGVAKIDGEPTQYFATLDAALTAAYSNGTIELLDDVTFAGGWTNAGVNPNHENNGYSSWKLTINGNGHKITPATGASADFVFSFNLYHTVTFSNVEFNGWGSKQVLAFTGGAVTLDKVVIKGTTTDASGSNNGLIRSDNSNLTVSNCTFANNTCAMVIGVNIAVGGGDVTISNNKFENNTCDAPGVVYFNKNTAGTKKLENNTFSGNTVTTSGNGAIIYCSGTVNGGITGNLFSGNNVSVTADKKEGVIVLGSGATGTAITGNAFVSNTLGTTATSYATIYTGADCDVSNNYWGDGEAAELGSGKDVYDTATHAITVTNYATAYVANDGANGVTVTLAPLAVSPYAAADAEANAFKTAHYGKHASGSRADAEDAFYVKVVDGPVGTVASVKINGTTYAAADTIAVSVGSKAFVDGKYFVAREDGLYVAFPVVCFDMAANPSTVAFGDYTFSYAPAAGSAATVNSLIPQKDTGSAYTVTANGDGTWTLRHTALQPAHEWLLFEIQDASAASSLVTKKVYTDAENNTSITYGISTVDHEKNTVGIWYYPFGYADSATGYDGNTLDYYVYLVGAGKTASARAYLEAPAAVTVTFVNGKGTAPAAR